MQLTPNLQGSTGILRAAGESTKRVSSSKIQPRRALHLITHLRTCWLQLRETSGTTTMTQLLVVFLGLVSMAGAGLESVSLHAEGQGRTLQGENYRLVCVVTPPQPAHTSPAFFWYRDGKLLHNQTGKVLNFTPLSKHDVGDYRCGLNLSEVQLSHSVSLHIMVFENISLVPEVEVEEGQTVILNCSVHSDPTAFLTWRLGGKTLYTVRSNSDSLVLHNASQYHLQVVECEAYNNGLFLGFLDAYSLIRLKGTYEVVPTPWLHASVVPVLHRPFRMECLVMELPNQGVNVHLTYTWYKDDELMEGQSDMILDIPSMTKEDQGVYTCTARNGKGRTTSLYSNSLDVLVLLPPVVHIEPSTTDNVIKRVSGETLTLTCEVTEALPWINKGGYRWSYLPSPGGQLRPLEGRENTLTLGPLTREDSGQYICQAWNDALFEGLIPPGNTSVTVDVTYLENVTLTSTHEVSEGDHVTLTCSVDSNPAARVSWLVEGWEVRHVTANVDHYVLERAACSDNKTYTCRASIPHLPGLEISRSSDILVNCTDIARSTPHSSSANVTSVVEDEGPQADVSSSSFALTVGLSVSMSILVVAVIVAVIVIIVHHTGRNHERPSSVEQYRNCPSGDAV